MKILEKLKTLTDEQLIQLSEEMRTSIVPEDALIREVIKGTEVETTQPLLAFVAVGQNLTFVVADRLIKLKADIKKCNEDIKNLKDEIEGMHSHGDASY